MWHLLKLLLLGVKLTNMKRILLIASCFALFLVGNPYYATATSGSCSYHSGVNCSIGPTLEGKVQCNDGWVNSTVYYADTDECKVTAVSCEYPAQPYCSLSQIETDRQSALGSATSVSGRSGLLGSDFASSQNDSINAQYDAEYSACENEWDLYEAQEERYERCLDSGQDFSGMMDKAHNLKIYDQLTSLCGDTNGSGSNPDMKKFEARSENPCTPTKEDFDRQCRQIHPESYYNSNESTCYCGGNLFYDSALATCVEESVGKSQDKALPPLPKLPPLSTDKEISTESLREQKVKEDESTPLENPAGELSNEGGSAVQAVPYKEPENFFVRIWSRIKSWFNW